MKSIGLLFISALLLTACQGTPDASKSSQSNQDILNSWDYSQIENDLEIEIDQLVKNENDNSTIGSGDVQEEVDCEELERDLNDQRDEIEAMVNRQIERVEDFLEQLDSEKNAFMIQKLERLISLLSAEGYVDDLIDQRVANCEANNSLTESHPDK